MKLSEEPIETKQKKATFEDGQKIKFTKSGLINNPNAFEVSNNPFGDDGQNQLQYCGVYTARYQGKRLCLQFTGHTVYGMQITLRSKRFISTLVEWCG